MPQYNLGVMYQTGRGVAPDATEAVRWYREAAEMGYAAAQYNLGVSAAKATGMTQDMVQALKWFVLATERGIPQAKLARDRIASEVTGAQVEEAERMARDSRSGKLRDTDVAPDLAQAVNFRKRSNAGWYPAGLLAGVASDLALALTPVRMSMSTRLDSGRWSSGDEIRENLAHYSHGAFDRRSLCEIHIGPDGEGGAHLEYWVRTSVVDTDQACSGRISVAVIRVGNAEKEYLFER